MEESGLPAYSNFVGITVGAYDLVMEFAFDQPIRAEGEAAERRPVAQVVMSLAHAKAMIPLLARVIAEYEKQAGGPIPAPGFEGFGQEGAQ